MLHLLNGRMMLMLYRGGAGLGVITHSPHSPRNVLHHRPLICDQLCFNATRRLRYCHPSNAWA